jgi:integrase
MSVYRDPKSPYYQYSFQIRGHRFYGSTKCTNRREAEAVEGKEKETAKRRIAEQQGASTSLLLDHVIDRYWQEVARHHAGAKNTWTHLERLIDFLGKDKLLTEITDDDVARLVAWRRGHRSKKASQLVAPTTVNHTTTKLLRRIFNCARIRWNVRFERQPNWQNHMLQEPEERVRELVGDEDDRLETATRRDYKPLFEFMMQTGLRKTECYSLRWSEVNWQSDQITKLGKGSRRVTAPITSAVRAILEPLQGHHPEFVFTFVALRTNPKKGKIKGHRYPITLAGLNKTWAGLRKRAGVSDLRLHDLRHDFASKLLRQTGNLKLVQKALNHASLRTTTKYAHVFDEEVAAALESFSQNRRSLRNSDENHRKNHRNVTVAGSKRRAQ